MTSSCYSMQKLEKCHREVSMMTASMREKETYEQLNAKVGSNLSMYAARASATPQVCRSSQDHDEICFALLYSILTDPTSAPKVHTHPVVSLVGWSLLLYRPTPPSL